MRYTKLQLQMWLQYYVGRYTGSTLYVANMNFYNFSGIMENIENVSLVGSEMYNSISLKSNVYIFLSKLITEKYGYRINDHILFDSFGRLKKIAGWNIYYKGSSHIINGLECCHYDNINSERALYSYGTVDDGYSYINGKKRIIYSYNKKNNNFESYFYDDNAVLKHITNTLRSNQCGIEYGI